AIEDCNTGGADGLADNLDYGHARPSSFHQEGFNIAYADGSVEFFFVDPDTAQSDVQAIIGAKMTPANGD
ncbi:MAG: H-X9-DG-CTERM domain-containing protein, partial [Pirellulales bacterium]